MQVIISTRGMTVSRTYKDELTRRLAKLEPMLPALVETRAVLSKEKHRRTAALTLLARRRAFRSRETAPDLEAAVDRAVHALCRQVRETKARRPRRPAGRPS
ncbi:MAG: HPF/RaiA family ribosome-associated protein [Candidatus Rokuibacteriota bacterium]